MGRFLSEDPVAFGGLDTNLYRYVRNNPVNHVDPSGKIPLYYIIAGGSAVLIFAAKVDLWVYILCSSSAH